MSEKNKPELERFARVAWTYADIQTLRPRWSRERCEEFLRANSDNIQERMIERGWEAIEALL